MPTSHQDNKKILKTLIENYPTFFDEDSGNTTIMDCLPDLLTHLKQEKRELLDQLNRATLDISECLVYPDPRDIGLRRVVLKQELYLANTKSPMLKKPSSDLIPPGEPTTSVTLAFRPANTSNIGEPSSGQNSVTTQYSLLRRQKNLIDEQVSYRQMQIKNIISVKRLVSQSATKNPQDIPKFIEIKNI